MRKIALVALALAFAVGRLSAADPAPEKPAPKPAFEATEDYAVEHVEGWDVLVSKRLRDDEHKDLRERTLKELGDQLYRITRVVPEKAVTKLRRIPVWVELEEPHHPCMCYHPSAGWLKDNGMNPAKERAVEIANARNFLGWTINQPWMVLH